MGAAFATTRRPLRALDATTVDAGLANAPAKADVRAEEARRKEARTRAACAAGATATAERVAMVLADTRCELVCVLSARERARRGRNRGRRARTPRTRTFRDRQRSIDAFDRRVPASFTGKRRPVTGDLDRQSVDSIRTRSDERQVPFRNRPGDFSRTGEALDRVIFFSREIRHRVGRSRR